MEEKDFGKGLWGMRHVCGSGERLMEEEEGFLWTRKLDDITCREGRLLEMVVDSWRRRKTLGGGDWHDGGMFLEEDTSGCSVPQLD